MQHGYFKVVAWNCGAAPRFGAKKGSRQDVAKISFTSSAQLLCNCQKAFAEGFVVLPSFSFREVFREKKECSIFEDY